MGESAAAAGRGLVCLVTIHGIGFQQAPGPPDRPGYADLLHLHLAAALAGSGRRLSDDPHRQAFQRGATVPIYVRSDWSPDAGSRPSREAGLERLGSWSAGRDRVVVTDRARLVTDGADVAHVALVYSGLEESRPDPVALVDTALIGLGAVGRWDSVAAIAVTLARNVAATFSRPAGRETAAVSPRVRSDQPAMVSPLIARIPWDSHESILVQIEDDVGAYVVRNERRELVRGFVEDALLRLLAREDVRAVVVDAHSQGTVLAYDVLRQLPGAAIGKVGAFVTAGSPLRKYATALSWGTEVGRIQEIPAWLNVYDRQDIIADELRRPPSGRARSDLVPAGSLFWWLDPLTGIGHPSRVADEQVDNVRHSPPGPFPAHDYWNNQSEFVPKLATVLSEV